jgi:signal transduction histidine kinase
VAAGMTGVLDELREIARGIHPAILADGGLRPALKALARRFPVPVRLDVQVEGRLPEQTEIAAYYVVSEALTNTTKHAHATAADVQVAVAAGDGVLRVRVRDDGRGGAGLTSGSGLVGLRDRAEALGGHLLLHSVPGAGTDVQVSLPLMDLAGGAGQRSRQPARPCPPWPGRSDPPASARPTCQRQEKSPSMLDARPRGAATGLGPPRSACFVH